MSPDSPGIGRSRMHSLDDTPKALRHNDFDNLTLPDTDLSGFIEANFNANLRDDIQTAIAYHRRRIVSNSDKAVSSGFTLTKVGI